MWIRRSVAAILLALAVAGLAHALPSGELRDYGSFVASGRAASDGLNPYGIHPLTFHVVLPGFEVWNPNLNPPVSIPAFRLLGWIDPYHGFRLWWSISLACYVAAVFLLVRRYGHGPAAIRLIFPFALAGFADTLLLGQIYLPLVLAACGAWLLLDRRCEIAAGVLIGIVMAVKPNFAVWPALLLIARHYRPALWAFGTALALTTVPIATEGWRVYAAWLDVIRDDPHRLAFLTNASIVGLFQRAGLGSLGILAAAVVLVTLSVRAYRRTPSALDTSAMGIAGAILASPVAWVHYTLFLLPVFCSRRLPVPMLLAAALLTVPVKVVLWTLDAPLFQQLTIGSAYAWAMLLCMGALLRPAAPPLRQAAPGDGWLDVTPTTPRSTAAMITSRS